MSDDELIERAARAASIAWENADDGPDEWPSVVRAVLAAAQPSPSVPAGADVAEVLAGLVDEMREVEASYRVLSSDGHEGMDGLAEAWAAAACWKFHVHHWHIQVSPLQSFRRWLLTRCEWCGGKSRKGSPVNVSHQWDAPRGRWWRGEPGVFHRDCSTAWSAHKSCICEDPLLDSSGYGRCALCGLFREWGRKPEWDARIRELKQIPANTKPPS